MGSFAFLGCTDDAYCRSQGPPAACWVHTRRPCVLPLSLPPARARLIPSCCDPPLPLQAPPQEDDVLKSYGSTGAGGIMVWN